jgi:hypothetical protein
MARYYKAVKVQCLNFMRFSYLRLHVSCFYGVILAFVTANGDLTYVISKTYVLKKLQLI